MAATVNDDAPRARLLDVLAGIIPADAREREHLEFARAWVGSGAEVYRRGAIDVPPTHLVVYFAPLDTAGNADGGRILLVAHRKAGLWLPAGGHVEAGEDPWDTVARECQEELRVPAVPSAATGPHPVFLSVNRTRHGPVHTDVSLWYLLDVGPERIASYDDTEFTTVRWWPLHALQQQLATPAAEGFEPHLGRFLDKRGTPGASRWDFA